MTKQQKPQKFSIGYHLNSWDLTGQPLRPALHFLADQGFQYYELLDGSSLGQSFARKYMTLPPSPPQVLKSDADMFARFATVSEAQRHEPIRMSALYSNGEFINEAAWDKELELFETVLRLLQGFEAPILCLGGGPPARQGEPHSASDYKSFATSLAEVGRRAQDLGIDAVYHPHLDTFVETREQLDRVMDVLDTKLVGLCIDPAHLAHTQSDPVDALRTHVSAVRYMHFKDTRVGPDLVGVARYSAFCELGAGVVDFRGLTQTLLDAEYDGIVIVELDASQKSAEQSAVESKAYLTDQLGLSLKPTTR